MMRVFRVTTSKGCVWQGVAYSCEAAESIACNVFCCPMRSIVKIEIVKIID